MNKKSLIFYIALFLLILVITMSANYFDYDLWARLIAGMGVIEGGHVLKTDFLSYTPVHTWFDHEWGSGVIFYLFLNAFGPYSLIILQALLLFGIFFTASKIVKLRNNNPYNILFYFFALMAALNTLQIPVRCHMFSFLLFTVFIYLLELVRRGKTKLLYLIPFIIILWNNIHGGVVAGLGVLFIYAVGEFFNKKPFKNYLITLAVSIPALLINPWGYEYLKFLLMANTMQRTYIVEWWSIFSKFYLFKYLEFKFFMFASVIIELISVSKSVKNWYKNADKVKYLLLLMTLYLAISHAKLMPFFVITSLCFVYEDFYSLIKDLKLPAWKDKIIYTFIISISLFSLAVKEYSVPVGMDIYPVKEVEFIKKNNIKGNILVNFGYGSYVSYKLYPNNLIFMDGRYEEVYYDYMVPMLKEFSLSYPHWKEILTYFPPDIIIVEKIYPAYKTLKAYDEWKEVYEGKHFSVFLPASASHTELLPTDDLNYYKNTLFTTDINFKL